MDFAGGCIQFLVVPGGGGGGAKNLHRGQIPPSNVLPLPLKTPRINMCSIAEGSGAGGFMHNQFSWREKVVITRGAFKSCVALCSK